MTKIQDPVKSSLVDDSALAQIVLASDDDRTVYVPIRGNAGDSFIGESTYQFLDGIRLHYTVASFNDRVESGSRVLIGGGGNLTPLYNNVRAFIERNLDSFREVVVLPHTILGHQDLLGRLDERFTLICRERRSFDFTSAHAPRARVLLGDDMAFRWDRESTTRRAREASLANVLDLQLTLRNLKHLIRSVHLRTRIAGGRLNPFREDVESARQEVPHDNADLSQLFATDATGRGYAACATAAMAGFLERAETVRTDRLHVAILSALLGKQVEMHDNSYGKNRAVFEHSIAGRFPNVTFVE